LSSSAASWGLLRRGSAERASRSIVEGRRGLWEGVNSDVCLV
jgi:hypothetical protein